MNVNSIKSKKSLKIAILLLSSLLVAGVSASTYYTMFMTGSIGVSTGNKVYFTPGADWGSSSMGSGNQSVTLSLTGPNGTATTVSDPVRIYNNDTTSHSLNLQLDSWTGDTETQLNYINVTMYNDTSGGTQQGSTIYLVPTGGGTSVTETGSVSINSGATWRVEWIIYWKANATSPTDTVTVNLKLIVS